MPVVIVTSVLPIEAISPTGAKGLAVDPTTGITWAIFMIPDKQATYHMLATLDPVTGVATPVGYPDVPFSADFAGIAFDGSGNLFGVTGNSLGIVDKQVDLPYSLYQLSKVDGTPTFLYQFPEPPDILTRGEAIAFNSTTGLMVHATGDADRMVRELNLSTLAIAGIPLTGDANWERPTAMTHDSVNDILYLADMTYGYYATLYTIDQNAKAAESQVGEFTDYDEAIKGLAFRHDRDPLGMEVELDGSGSYDPDGNPIVSWAWSLVQAPPGSTAAILDPSSMYAMFFPDVLGDYVFGLVVNDGTQDSAQATVGLSYVNAPPVADAGIDQALEITQATVQLNGTASYDPEFGPLTYAWTIAASPALLAMTDGDISDPTSPVPSVSIPGRKADKQAGPYDIVLELTVTDELAVTGTDTVTIDASAMLAP